MKHRYLSKALTGLLLCLWLYYPAANAQQHPETPSTISIPPLPDRIADIRDTTGILDRIRDVAQLEEKWKDSSISLLLRIREKCIALKFVRGVNAADAELGNAYTVKGDYRRAIQHYFQALLITRNKTDWYANILNNMAGAYMNLGEYEQAVRCYERALSIAGQYDDPATESVLNDTYNNYIVLLLELKKYEEAAYYLNKLIQTAQTKKTQRLLAACYINKGALFGHIHNQDSSKYYLDLALTIAEQEHYTDLQFATLTNLAVSYADAGDFPRAIGYHLRAEQLTDSVELEYLIEHYKNFGHTYFRYKDYTKAIPYLLAGIRLSEQTGFANRGDLHSDLAESYMALNLYKQAAEQFRIFIQLNDSLENEQVLKDIGESELKFRAAEKDKELLAQQLLILQQDDYLRRKNIWITGISAGAFALLLLMLSLYRSNTHKRRAQEAGIALLQQQLAIAQLKATIEGEEKERRRIGRELHDGISGRLTAINLNIAAIRQRHKGIAAMDELAAVMDMLQAATLEIRKTAHNLIPDYLLQKGLPEVLTAFTADVSRGGHLQLETYFTGNLDALDKSFALIMFRIIQELVHNIIKHAYASYAEVQVRSHNEQVTISVEDNGVGFDTNSKTNGLGLQQIKARVEGLSGFISVESYPGKGTTIYIEFNNSSSHHNLSV